MNSRLKQGVKSTDVSKPQRLIGTMRHTDAGDVPIDWEVDHLSKRWDVIDCKHITAEFVFSGIPVVSIREVQGRFVDVTEARQTTKVFYAQLTEGGREPYPGDLILSRNATVGEVAQVAAWHPSFAMGQDVCLLRKRSPGYSTDFLQSVFESDIIARQLGNLMVGSTFRRVNVQQVKALVVPFPPPHEQRAIAEALSDVDGLLAALEVLIAKKRAIKQAAMQQLLTGKTRLPGFSGEWQTKTLFDLAQKRTELFDDGDWIESEHITTQGIRLIQTGNIGVGRFMEKEDKKFIYEESFTLLRCKQLRMGDLLVCRLADPAGRACVLPDIGEERIVTSVDVTIFRPPPEVADRVFLANMFSTPDWFRVVSDRSGGTTHKRISRGALGRIAIKLPPRIEQAAIATVLSDMDAEIAVLERRRDKTRAIKQGMMQQLLTGRVRLLEPQLADSAA